MTTLNKSLCPIRNRCSTISKWPVEETGKNSVIPSTTPRSRTAIQSGMGWLDGKTARKTRKKTAADRWGGTGNCSLDNPGPAFGQGGRNEMPGATGYERLFFLAAQQRREGALAVVFAL